MYNIRVIVICSIIIFGLNNSESQTYEVEVSPITIEGLGGLHSYAVGTCKGDWLLVGGRLDGLHQREPFASFSADGKNQDLIVVNPKKNQVWRAPLSSLPKAIVEQLSSTNMQYYQHNNKLLCTGGYAYSRSVEDHITFPYLTIIDIPKTIDAIKNNKLNDSTFYQIENEAFRVTGGALDRIGDIYHLVGGHKFMGAYNPMGPEHGPGFVQEYTDEIRRFKINIEGNYSIEILDPIHDAMHLHRRDYNLAPYLSKGERELMIYSGVFKNTVDRPWLYPVSITKDTHKAHEDFNQYFNHYHCAYLPIYDSREDDMHTIFFGGIAQFYTEGDLIVQDNDVPFVNTIAEISRDSEGVLSETRLSSNMPGYLGAGSVFIFDSESPLIDNDILDGVQISDELIDVGYIYGGIRSSLSNIFWLNTGTQSEANHIIYKVAIRKADESSSATTVAHREFLHFYPNVVNHYVRMSIDIDNLKDLEVIISDMSEKTIYSHQIAKTELMIGRNYLKLEDVAIGYGAYNYIVKIGSKVLKRKVIWSE